MQQKRKFIPIFLLVFLSPLLLVLSDTGRAEPGEEGYRFETDWKSGGELSHLAEYIGTKNYEAVLDDPYVKETLKEMLGDEVAWLQKNLSARSTIDLENANLILYGNKPHEVGLGGAILLVNLHNGRIQAGIYSRGKTKIYSKTSGYVALPQSLKLFIHWNEIYPIKERYPDANFEWVR